MTSIKDIISKVTTYVGWLLLITATCFYAYGIYDAVVKTLKSSATKYPEFLATTTSSIQALLLTNLGMLLGISISIPSSNIARSLKLNSVQGTLDASVSPMQLKEQIQLSALAIYVISLVICLVTWISTGFNTDTKITVTVISESSKMFVGVVLAYLTVALSK